MTPEKIIQLAKQLEEDKDEYYIKQLKENVKIYCLTYKNLQQKVHLYEALYEYLYENAINYFPEEDKVFVLDTVNEMQHNE